MMLRRFLFDGSKRTVNSFGGIRNVEFRITLIREGRLGRLVFRGRNAERTFLWVLKTKYNSLLCQERFPFFLVTRSN